MSLLKSPPHDNEASASCNLQLGALACDAHHHHYHYQASAQYAWLAESCVALALWDEARTAYDKAIFQDHRNGWAIARRNNPAPPALAPLYDRHPVNAVFRARVEEHGGADMLHDEAQQRFDRKDYAEALTWLDKAIAAEPDHSDNFFLRGRCHFIAGQYALARADFSDAIRLSHAAHNRYHRRASGAHLARAEAFFAAGNTELALNECTKALDLDANNPAALSARARMRGERS